MNKYWKKSHFISQKLIFHCLKKNPSKKSRFFLYFRSYEHSELLVHENRTHTHTHTYIRTRTKNHISRRFRLFWVLWHYPHSTVILEEYFENIPLKSCNIAKIFIKLLERFVKYCRNLAMSINGTLLQY